MSPRFLFVGCLIVLGLVSGTPLIAPLTVSTKPSLAMAPVSLGALVVGLGLGWVWRRRITVAPVVMPSTPVAPIPPDEQTTARRATTTVAKLALRLVVWDERGRTEHALTGRQWLLGHDPGCHIVLHAAGVAPLHLRLAVAGDGIELTALDGVVTLGSPLGEPLAHGAPEWLALGEVVCVGPSTRVMLEQGRPV